MRNAQLLLAILVFMSVVQVEGADTRTPVLDVVVADGNRLTKHWHDSIYGKVWDSPALAPIRKKLDESTAKMEAELGFNPFAQMSSLVNARFQVIGATKKSDDDQDPVSIRFQMDLGSNATTFFTAIAKKGTPLKLTGADEAVLNEDETYVTARVGTILLIMPKGLTVGEITKVPVTDHDISIQFEGQALASALSLTTKAPLVERVKKVLEVVKPFLASVTGTVDLVPNGVRYHGVAQTTLSWLKPITTDWIAHVPDHALSYGCIAIDGAQLWKTLVHPLILASAIGEDKTGDQIEAEADAALASQGIDLKLADLVSGLKGTIFTVNTAAMPLIGITVGIPHSPALDKLVAWGLKKTDTESPASGDSVIVNLPKTVPVALSVVNTKEYWIASSDAQVASNWATPPTTDWTTTALGKLVKEKVGAGAFAFNVTDVAGELKTIQGYANIVLGMAPLAPKEKQAILLGLSQFIAKAVPGYEIGIQDAKTVTWDGEGSFSAAVSPASAPIIAAIAIPNLLESRISSNEASAAVSLRSGVFPAEVTYQAGNYSDRDKDGIGDFGFFPQLAAKERMLLAKNWDSPHPIINGYHFSIYIPDGEGGALSVENDHDVAPAHKGKGPETQFVAYAWPVDSSSGRRVFAITTSGVVYTSPQFITGKTHEPKWDDLFGNKGWEGTIVWPARAGSHRGNVPAATPAPPQAGDPKQDGLF